MKKTKMKTLLIFPPQINPIHPHLALPLLKSYLKKNNEYVEIMDLNILAYDYLLSKENLKKCKLKLKKIPYKKKNKFQELASLMADYLIENVEQSKELIRTKKIMEDFKKYQQCVRTIKYALNLISSAYPGELLSLTQYKAKYGTDTTEAILKSINENNIFSQFHNDTVDKIIEKKPKLVGFSIVLVDQLVPAMDLAKKIKTIDPKIKIVMGGTTITRLIESIKEDKLFFKYVDFYIKKEGEIAILELIKAIKDKTELEKVPNLLWLNKSNNDKIEYVEYSKIKENKELQKQIPIKNLPFPDFKGFDLSLYISPMLVIPTIFSRNCYWNKCTFCDICHGYDKTYRIKGIKKIIEEIAFLKKKYNSEYFRFVDEAIHPIHLKDFAKELIKLKLNLKWETACRPEKEFKDKSFCKLLYKSGCRSLSFGLETGSQKVVDLMNKGYNVNNIHFMLNAVNNAGISSHIYLMTDFPGETKEDFQKTVDMMLRNKKNIQSFQVSRFILTKKSEISKTYKHKKNDHGKASLNFNIENETGRQELLKYILKTELPNHKIGQELICTHRMIFTEENSNEFHKYDN